MTQPTSTLKPAALSKNLKAQPINMSQLNAYPQPSKTKDSQTMGNRYLIKFYKKQAENVSHALSF